MKPEPVDHAKHKTQQSVQEAQPVAAGRGRLLRFSGWFVSCQALLLMLIGSLYLWQLGWPSSPLAQLYTLTAVVMHFSMLAYLPWLLLIIPLILLFPRYAVVRGWLVLVAAIVTAGLLLDGLLYVERQFHINALTMQILGWHTWAFGLFYLLLFSALGFMLSGRLWAWTAKRPASNRGKWPAITFVSCYLCSQLIFAWADASYYAPVTRMGYTLPLYHPLTAKGFLSRHGLVDMQQNRERRMLDSLGKGELISGDQGALAYPLAPLQCQQKQRFNLLVILIDAMRADMLQPQLTPNIHRLAVQAGNFRQHFSGGNSSRMGVFSLFYGLPANYWKAFEAMQLTPVMMDELQRQGYQFGIFGSSPLYRPVSLDRTAFANIPGLRVETVTETNLGWERDQAITRDWLAWLSQHQDASAQPNAPFFGFLFYDGPTSRSYPPDYGPRLETLQQQGMERELARYQLSVQHDDALVGQVLADLDKRQLLDNTVVLISADHGQEFDDSGQGFNGHGSAYTPYQLQVPFVLHWPGQSAAVYEHRTSHSDWVVTVMQRLLGCSDPPEQYASLGKDLYQPQSWPWLIAGSYHNFAVVSPEQTIISHINGAMEVRDPDYRLVERPQLDRQMIAAALKETTRFYRGQ